MTTELALMTASELLLQYRRKTISPVDAVRAALARIDQFNSQVNAYCLVDEDGALAAARASEQRWQRGAPSGLLDGVPCSIKDIILTRGWPTLRGSKTVDQSQSWEEDAPVTARLREQGAIFLGKTTTPEFGWKGVTDSPLTGITRNPWNLATTPGGSSGGAAVAAALGMGALHIGTDGGGSIRIPAGFTGIFGHKPSFGRVPAYPLSPFGTVAHVGPMTRSVTDAALMLTVLARPDARDWHALPFENKDYRIGLEQSLQGWRIAFSLDLGYAEVDAEIAEKVAEAAQIFADLGAVVERADPSFSNPLDTFNKHWYTGAANALSGVSSDRLALIEPGLREIASAGAAIPHMDYIAATNARGRLGQTMTQFHKKYDLLLTPSLPIPAFAAGQEVPDPAKYSRWPEWTPFSHPFNLTQQPAASIPCGFTQAGLPIGLQIVGPMHRDDRVLQAARAYESVQPLVFPKGPRHTA